MLVVIGGLEVKDDSFRYNFGFICVGATGGNP